MVPSCMSSYLPSAKTGISKAIKHTSAPINIPTYHFHSHGQMNNNLPVGDSR